MYKNKIKKLCCWSRVVSLVLMVLFLLPIRGFPGDIDATLMEINKKYEKWYENLKKELKNDIKKIGEDIAKIDITCPQKREITEEFKKIEKETRYDAKNQKIKEFSDYIEKCDIPMEPRQINEIKKDLLGFQEKMKTKNVLKQCLEKMGILKKDEMDLRKPSISIGTGFYGDQAGDHNLYNLVLDANLDYTVYPNEFRFQAGTRVQFQDGAMNENMTTLLVNYDHYMKPWLEIYGFMQRFSDSYLSIQHRYDIGLGCKFEYNLSNSRRAKNKAEQYHSICKSLDYFETVVNSSLASPHDRDALKESVKKLRDKARNYNDTFNKIYSSLELSMAFSLFADLEQAELEVPFCETVDNVIVKSTKKIPLEANQRLMLSLRPKIVFRPLDYITLKGYIYFKYPLTGETRLDGRLDLCKDAFLSLEVGMPGESKFAEKLSFILEYQYHFDSVPPFLPQDILDKYQLDGPVIAEGTHQAIVFKLAIKF